MIKFSCNAIVPEHLKVHKTMNERSLRRNGDLLLVVFSEMRRDPEFVGALREENIAVQDQVQNLLRRREGSVGRGSR